MCCLRRCRSRTLLVPPDALAGRAAGQDALSRGEAPAHRSARTPARCDNPSCIGRGQSVLRCEKRRLQWKSHAVLKTCTKYTQEALELKELIVPIVFHPCNTAGPDSVCKMTPSQARDADAFSSELRSPVCCCWARRRFASACGERIDVLAFTPRRSSCWRKTRRRRRRTSVDDSIRRSRTRPKRRASSEHVARCLRAAPYPEHPRAVAATPCLLIEASCSRSRFCGPCPT